VAKLQRERKSGWLLVTLLIIGGIVGTGLGQIFAPHFPFLQHSWSVGLRPGVLDLRFLTITFGFSAVINPATLLGFLLGYLVYTRI